MSECQRVRAAAPALAGLPHDDPERVAAWAHARGCADCARALREGERLQALVGEWTPPAPTAVLGGTARAIVAELRRETKRRTFGSTAAVLGALLLLVVLARARSPSVADWGVAAVLGVLAVALAAAASRKPPLVAAVTVVAAVAAATVPAGPGSPSAAVGVHCVAAELLAAAAVVGAVALALRGGTTSPARAGIAAAAAAGALAGDAALQITCGARSVPHDLAFHVGGIVLAFAAARLLWRAPARGPAWSA